MLGTKILETEMLFTLILPYVFIQYKWAKYGMVEEDRKSGYKNKRHTHQQIQKSLDP